MATQGSSPNRKVLLLIDSPELEGLTTSPTDDVPFIDEDSIPWLTASGRLQRVWHEFQTHDNGGRPFLVRADEYTLHSSRGVGRVRSDALNTVVEVYRNSGVGSYQEANLLCRFTATTVYVAVGEAYRHAHPDGLAFPEAATYLPWPEGFGNAILVKETSGSYVYIGMSILRFEMDRVVRFRSPVGNNDVPYTYATTATHTYLIGHDEVLRSSDVNLQDPWGSLFGNVDGFESVPWQMLVSRS